MIEKTDVFILICTTGEIMHASMIPIEVKRNNVKILVRYTQLLAIFTDSKSLNFLGI